MVKELKTVGKQLLEREMRISFCFHCIETEAFKLFFGLSRYLPIHVLISRELLFEAPPQQLAGVRPRQNSLGIS
jgi:hypothetical protein